MKIKYIINQTSPFMNKSKIETCNKLSVNDFNNKVFLVTT